MNIFMNHTVHPTTAISRLIALVIFTLLAINGSAQTVTVSGKIGDNLEGDFLVQAISNDTVIEQIFPTSDYSMELPAGKSWLIRPCGHTDFPLNGLTTFDVVMLGRHIRNVENFTSPYQIIAADVDFSNTVNFDDSLHIRNLILGIYTELPIGVIYRFVPEDYVFPNPSNPFVPMFPEYAATGVLNEDLADVNFIAVRLGDFNGSSISSAGGTQIQCLDFPTIVEGHLTMDPNFNCAPDTGETGLSNWIVQAYNAMDTFSTLSSTGGYYRLPVLPGAYQVRVLAPNNLWSVCSNDVSVTVDLEESIPLEFSAQPAVECPFMSVDISTPLLRRCFNNYYSVQYCNQGTVTATEAYIVIRFDPYFNVTGSSIPWSAVSGNNYSFPLGDVAPGECGTFYVYFGISCDAELGQTHCTAAHIYPDSLCGPAPQQWNGADLTISGECTGDLVVFTITNTGEAMTEPVGYVVIEDIMIQMAGSGLQLGAGESTQVTLPANGSTWRLEVDQPEAHPFQLLVSAAIEGCGLNQNGTFTLGVVEQFPMNDETPYEDEDCRANIGSYDPNDKQGFPTGVTAAHYIPLDQTIDYLIRFQNTGTDTAFNIMILDTLSEFLDPATIRPLGSSHPYQVHLLENNVLQFAFPNIMLPDSNVNEPASNGFVKFSIQPKAGLSDGVVIENEAAIYFDFNAPIFTNTTLHTLGKQYLRATDLYGASGVEISVAPNPAVDHARFSLHDYQAREGRLQIFTAQGMEIRSGIFSGNYVDLDVRTLPQGLYFFRISDGGSVLGGGKMVK
jgi:hypothetical protein